MSEETRTPMMACGHTANATDGDGNPCCVICAGIDAGHRIVVGDVFEQLLGRRARCFYHGKPGRNHSCNHSKDTGCTTDECRCELPSTLAMENTLAFFEHCPDAEHDQFYCGCHGWE